MTIKSKAFKFLLGIAVVFGVALAFSASAYDFGAATLRVGSRGADVMEVQRVVGVEDDGVFGPMTEAAVKAWQLNNGITPVDGIVGSITKAAMSSSPLLGTFPAGCTSNEGFSSTTGLSCAVVVGTLPAGCTSTAGFSPTTGQSCSVVTTLPAGCTSTVGYSVTTGASCSSTSQTGTLTGGAGDASINETSTNVESTINEGDSDVKVHGFKVEADGSDIAVTNLKVSFLADGAVASSLRLNHYVDSVSVWMDGKKVGSVDVDDFSKDGNTYSKTIALSNAVVKEGNSNKETFYITVDAVSNMDSADFNGNWTLTVNNIRFQDATGVVLTDTYSETSLFDFTSLALSGDVKVTVSKDSSSPIAQNIEVSDTSSTKDVLLLAYKVKATGSDVTFDTVSVTLTSVGDDLDNILGEITLNSGKELANTSTFDADGSQVVVFNLDDTFTIDAGDTEVFQVYVTVNDADNFVANSTVKADFTSFSPEDENGDVIVDTGSASGEAQAFVVDVPTFTLVGTPTLANYQHTDGTGAGAEDLYKATIKFNVTAPEDQEIYLPLDSFAFGAFGTSGVEYTASAGAITSAALVYTGSDTLTENGVDNNIRIEAGDTQEFTLTVYLTGDDAQGRVTLTSVWYETTDVATDGNPEVTTGFTNFKTPLVLLAK